MLPLLLALALGAPAPLLSPPVRQSAQAFGKPMDIEVRGLPAE
jgi:hypothetical protein